MADAYLTEVAGMTGLTVYPGQGPFGHKHGAAMGTLNGHVVAIGEGTDVASENQRAVNILVRYKKVEMPETVRAAVAAHPGVLAALGTAEFKSSHGKHLSAAEDTLIWSMPFTLKKDKPDQVATMAGALVDAVKGVASHFGGKCEICGTNSVSELLLFNSVPGAYCSGCQENMRHEQEQVARAYEMAESSPGRGLVLALLAALACGLAWGAVAFYLERIFLWGAIGIGYLVGWAYFKGAGKIETLGQVAISLLTVGSVVFGDIFFIALVAQKLVGEPLSFELMEAAALAYSENLGDHFMSLLFGLGGAVYAMYKWRKPRFEAAFERLGQGT